MKKMNDTILRFTPTAWAKLLFFRDLGKTEIGGFGITKPDDLLLVTDFVTVKQNVSMASVKFDDTAVADFFEDQVAAGRHPREFARIWVHTHPMMSPSPSGVDEETFERVFGSCDWAIMFIISSTSKTYCKLYLNVGLSIAIDIPVEVSYTNEFGPSDFAAWKAEYEANICKEVYSISKKHTSKVFKDGIWSEEPGSLDDEIFDDDDDDDDDDTIDVAEGLVINEQYDDEPPMEWAEELEAMTEEERAEFLQDLYDYPDELRSSKWM